mmetsp:Transcript_111793/g.311057  ORF Transcript_111793/g.311057 Transcript_111793/m.311057 type:complete len:213 (+) Transcript_111793:711-1349(+)
MPSGWLKTTSALRPQACERSFTTGTFADSMISSQLISPVSSMWSASIFMAVVGLHGTSRIATSTSPLGNDNPVKNEPKTRIWHCGHMVRHARAMVLTHCLRAWISSVECFMNCARSRSSSWSRSTVFCKCSRRTNHGGWPSSTAGLSAPATSASDMKAPGALPSTCGSCSLRCRRCRRRPRIRRFRRACSAFLSASSSMRAASSSRIHADAL